MPPAVPALAVASEVLVPASMRTVPPAFQMPATPEPASPPLPGLMPPTAEPPPPPPPAPMLPVIELRKIVTVPVL